MSPTVLLLTSVLTGVFFCAWPLRMNQSGLPGPAAMLAYATVSIIVALVVMAFSPTAWTALRGRPLSVGVQAGVLNVIGVMLFMTLMAGASRVEAPRLILIVVLTQTALSGLWAAYQAGSFEPRFAVGLLTALATVWLMR
jgi:hypothetical protein